MKVLGGFILIAVLVLSVLAAIIMYTSSPELESAPDLLENNGMQISSPVFKNMQRIPDEYTCQGSDINPPLEISGIPAEAQSLVLIVEDPDAPSGTWDHWIVFNIDPNISGVAPDSIPAAGKEVINSFGRKSYGGPCPPPGPEHRYRFRLFALKIRLDPTIIIDKPSLLTAMKEDKLASAEHIGTYSR